MTNKRFWLVILVIALVFGMTVVGCDDGGNTGGTSGTGGTGSSGGDTGETGGTGGGSNTDPALNGTWVLDDDEDFEMTFNNGNFESASEKGTYTTNGNNITMTTTQIYNDLVNDDKYKYPSIEEGWYTENELKEALPDFQNADNVFAPITASYSISDNKLTFTFDGDSQSTFTKKN